MDTFLIRLGSLDGWPQLQKLEEMETMIRSPDFVQEKNKEFVESFLYLKVLVQNKIIIAYLELLKNPDN